MFSGKKESKLWTILGIILFIVVIYFLSKHTHFITLLLTKSGPWAPIVATLIYPVLALTPITTDPVTIIIGVTYGPIIGATIAWVGNTLAAIVEYYIGYRISDNTNFVKSKEKMPFGLGKLPVNSVGFLVVGRMIPGYGGKIISILAGVYKVPVRRYVWTTALTNLLGSLLLAYGGFGLVKAIKISQILKILKI